MVTVSSRPRPASRQRGSVPSPARAALVGGVSLAAMAIVGAWANFGVLSPLLTQGQAAQAVSDVGNAETLFRFGTAAMILMAVLDIVVAIALYIVFERVDRGVAVASAAFRVAYAAGLTVAASHLVLVPNLLDSPDAAMLALATFDAMWQTSLILFAVHLLLIGYLAYRSGFMPRIFGVLLLIAGFGYLADGIGGVLVRDFSPTFALYTFVGEVALIFWLLIAGRRLPTGRTEGASDVL